MLDATRAGLAAQLRETGQSSAACRRLAEVYDRELAGRFVAAAGGAELAVIATGGWARRELAPYSDIDFLVLHDGDEALAEEVCDRLVYPLWDEKLAIAPAVEALLRDYYLDAREVVQVADRLLERARVPAHQPPRIAESDASFLTVTG